MKRKKNNEMAPKGGQHSTTKRKKDNEMAPKGGQHATTKTITSQPPKGGPALDDEKKKE